MRGFSTDEARVEYYATTLKQKLAAYEQILSKRKYLTGEVCYTLFYHMLPSF